MQLEWHKIVVPVDFSDSTDLILSVSAELATRFDAHLCLLHVLGASSSTDRGLPSDPQLAVPDESLVADLQARMQALAVGHGVKNAETAVRVGDAATEIHFYAAAVQADLIVIAPHGHGAIHRLLLGSVAADVVRMAERPVLVVPLAAVPPPTT